MSFKRKFEKLKREPEKFFYDMALFKFFSHKKIEPKKIEPKKIEPSVIGKISLLDGDFELVYFNKKIINSNTGYSTLFITSDSEDYLINKRMIGSIISDKDFIAFREKSIYYILEKDLRHNKSYAKNDTYNIFLRNKNLRSNLFSEFRNIVVHNPLTEGFVFLRNTNPFLKLICIVDSEDSLKFIKNYIQYVDVLITLEHFDLSEFNDLPRILKSKSHNMNFKIDNNENFIYPFISSYNNVMKGIDSNLLKLLKIALVDTSFKKECNILLPIISKISNLQNIDEYNKDNTIQGLIKYKYSFDNTVDFDTFKSIVDNLVIEELYLRDNLYCLYKDLILKSINEKDYKKLLLKTLEDGVNYEEI